MRALQHQMTGAVFLADRSAALLADSPRVGKTGTAIIAADMAWTRRILVVTTASGRPVWTRGFRDWSVFRRSTAAVYRRTDPTDADVLVVSWGSVADKALHARLMAVPWDLLILDESHYAKSPATRRTVAVYGNPATPGLSSVAARTWCLTGTPVPNAPNDLWPMLNALCPERIDSLGYSAFVQRYCVTAQRWVAGRMIETVKGGRNEKELAAKLDGFYLRRAQQDVGITEPVFEMLPVHIDGANIALGDADSAAILAAAEAGDTRTLDMHLGPLRRLTGQLKVPAIVELVKDELGNGPGKLVLMAWHTDVIEALFEGLGRYRPAIVHGSTTPQQRAAAAEAFQSDPACRVFIGQVQAAGEAIDLSAASELVFAEMSFVPAHMAQAAARICNHSQIEQPRVRVAALEGSIDEALAEILLRKVASIKQVIGR